MYKLIVIKGELKRSPMVEQYISLADLILVVAASVCVCVCVCVRLLDVLSIM